MDTFTADLDNITGGYNADHFLDDEGFNYAVQQMEDLGHDRERTAAAICEWIDRTPMWNCPNEECGKENLDESYAECPICETPNPSVAIVEITREGDSAHRAGHVWRLKVDGVYRGMFETKRQAHDAATSFTNGEG